MFKDKRHLSKGIRKNRGESFFMADFLFEPRLAPPSGIIFVDYQMANSQVVYRNPESLTLRGISIATLGYPFLLSKLRRSRL